LFDVFVVTHFFFLRLAKMARANNKLKRTEVLGFLNV
jgi:hypothetical protein